jgi:hypothetical protein
VPIVDFAGVDFFTAPLPFGLPRGRPDGTGLGLRRAGSIGGRPRLRFTPSGSATVGFAGAILIWHWSVVYLLVSVAVRRDWSQREKVASGFC